MTTSPARLDVLEALEQFFDVRGRQLREGAPRRLPSEKRRRSSRAPSGAVALGPRGGDLVPSGENVEDLVVHARGRRR